LFQLAPAFFVEKFAAFVDGMAEVDIEEDFRAIVGVDDEVERVVVCFFYFVFF
jgi:hypothetical protein